MFNIFNRNSKNQMEKSIKKYSEVLNQDVNLVIRTRYKGRQYTSYIEKISDKIIVFRCPIDEYEIIRFQEKSTINIELISSSGLYKTKLLILEKMVKDKTVYYKGEIVEVIEKSQKRQNYRLPIVLDVIYTLGKAECEGHTLDISAGGMLMETYEDMLVGKDIEIDLEIDDRKYKIEGTLLRKNRNYNNDTYLYNIRFNNLSNRHKKDILRYVHDNRHDIKSTY